MPTAQKIANTYRSTYQQTRRDHPHFLDKYEDQTTSEEVEKISNDETKSFQDVLDQKLRSGAIRNPEPC